MTKRDMKNPKSVSCRGRLGLSFYDKSTKYAKIFVEGKKWVKKRHFSRGVESGGGYE